ncbi:MAG: leucyl aminopeptidase family protein [Acidimicrobiales bacterium]
MPISLDVVAAGAVPPEVDVVGLPVVAEDDGPRLMPGLPSAVGQLDLPVQVDAAVARRHGFNGTAGQSLVLRGAGPEVVLVGVGATPVGDREVWRRAGAALVRGAGNGGVGAVVLPADLGPSSGDELSLDLAAAALTEGAMLAAYRFDPYRSSPKPAALERLVVLRGDAAPGTSFERGIARGAAVAGAVALARDLANTPAGDLTPSRLAERAADELDGRPGTTVEVWDEHRITAERLGGLLGVSRGSLEPPRLVWARYRPAEGEDPRRAEPAHVVLVGKGITFDSGGLSLKTADGMSTMKTDMSGAAIVLSVVAACHALDVPFRVTAIAPMAENMPGAAAIKPGDVLTIRNGMTVEVLNTDAEGRLVLADGLSLAAELEPDAIVDVATLTGAARIALGTSIAPVYGRPPAMATRLREAAAAAGEQLWPMPLPDEYESHVDSDVADMKNIGKAGEAGSIVAALILARFTGGRPWAHLDIAGTGRSSESSGYRSKGATGFGVRTLLELLTDDAPFPAPEG